MPQTDYKTLLEAGVHFGHLKSKWNPKMAPYIFMERNGVHIIDLNKTLASLDEALGVLKNMIRSGKRVMFVATKKQAKEKVTEEARRLNMPFVTDRWLGGMLTNFATIRKSLRQMQDIDKTMKSEEFMQLAKRERLMIERKRQKMERVLGGISDLNKPPAALFVVDVRREHIAVAEANKLGIPIFAMVDTNSNPEMVDYPIPANDDSFKSINILMDLVSQAVEEGLQERKQKKEEEKAAAESEKMEAEKKAEDQGESAESSTQQEAAEAPSSASEQDDNAKPSQGEEPSE